MTQVIQEEFIMILVKKCKKDGESEKDNKYSETFIDEECNWCRKNMTNTKYIYVDLISGNYCCKECGDNYGLNIVRCKELNY
jgi:hypothetical protein